MASVVVTGAVSALPNNAASLGGLSEGLSLALASQDFAKHLAGSITISSTLISPFPIAGLSVMRLVALRALGGVSLVAILSSAAGAAQLAPFGALLVIAAPAATPFTALAIAGVGDLEFIVAGDP